MLKQSNNLYLQFNINLQHLYCMKLSFKVLLLLFVVITGYYCLPLYLIESAPGCMDGKLSDIAKEVASITLKFPDNYNPKNITSVQKDGKDLFVQCNHELFHFNTRGECLGKISIAKAGKEIMPISQFTINPVDKQLIVIRKNKMAYFYGYSGVLLRIKNLAETFSGTKLLHIAFYNKELWITTEQLTANGKETFVQKKLCQYTTDFQPISSKILCQADLGRFYLAANFDPEIAVSKGNIYVHSPSLNPDTLVQDTLYLIETNQLTANRFDNEQTAKILPLRISERFLISNYYNGSNEVTNYTFCYDRKKNIAYSSKGGLKDDYFNAGRIADIRPLDISNSTFYFCRKTQPERIASGQHNTNPSVTLYLIKLEA